MDSNPVESHWQRVHSSADPAAASWHQAVPRMSIDLIGQTGVDVAAPILDAGGGSSLLVDHLLDQGFLDVTVLDLSANAIDLARKRLEARAEMANWICGDVTSMIPERTYSVWHDRALFHFLTDPVDRALYAAVLYEAVESDGWIILGTFAPDGPEACSGLPACRYDGSSLGQELGTGFVLEAEHRETHRTPAGVEQRFAWSVFRRSARV